MLKSLKIWTKATRAESLVASICPVIIGALLALLQTPIKPYIFSLTLFYTIALHAGTNLSNDYYDFLNKADTNDRIANFSTIQLKLTSLKQVKIAFISCFLLGLYASFLLSFKTNISISLFIIPIFAGFFYTGGKKPLGYIGLGEVLVLFFLGPYATFGTYYLQTNKFSLQPIIIGISLGLYSTLILIINNLRDIKLDKKAKKNTLSVIFGKKFTQIEYFLCSLIIVATTLYSYYLINKLYILFSLLSLFFLPFQEVKKYKDPIVLNESLKKTSFALIIYTILFSIGLFL